MASQRALIVASFAALTVASVATATPAVEGFQSARLGRIASRALGARSIHQELMAALPQHESRAVRERVLNQRFMRLVALVLEQFHAPSPCVFPARLNIPLDLVVRPTDDAAAVFATKTLRRTGQYDLPNDPSYVATTVAALQSKAVAARPVSMYSAVVADCLLREDRSPVNTISLQHDASFSPEPQRVVYVSSDDALGIVITHLSLRAVRQRLLWLSPGATAI